MKKRLIALLLVLVTVLGMLPATALAASSEEEALGEVNIYNGGTAMSYLSINGRIREQIYTYFNYVDSQGRTKEIPSYCVNPSTKGVPQSVAPGESIKYLAEKKGNDPKVMGIIANGYPTRGLSELKLENKYQAYYATKMALWCYLLPNWDISNLKVNPNLTGVELQRAQAILAASKDIYARGTTWSKVLSPRVTATPDRDAAYPVTVDGQQYKQQVFTLHSDTWVCNYAIRVAFSDPASVPEGTRIVDMENKDITTITTSGTGDGYAGKFKILYPASAVAGKTGSVQLSFTTDVYKYAVFYAVCAEQDKYGQLQNYMCDTDPTVTMRLTTFSSYGDDIEEETPDTGLKITKLEAGTDAPLGGAIFEVVGPDGATVGTFSTRSDGTVTIPLSLAGNYTVYERVAPLDHLLSDTPAQNIKVEYGKVAEITFWNEPYGTLRVEKLSNTGAHLPGAMVQVKHIESGTVYSAKTNFAGYAIKEATQEVYIQSGTGKTLTFENIPLSALVVWKYDSVTGEAVEGAVFQVKYLAGTSGTGGTVIGTYKTSTGGSFTVTGLREGTYIVEELASDSGHVIDTAPQTAYISGKEQDVVQLYFGNSPKGSLLVKKVDSATGKPISDVEFMVTNSNGTVVGDANGKFITDSAGSFTVSGIAPGTTLVVKETRAKEGYVLDDTPQTAKILAGQTVSLEFRNAPKGNLIINKLDSVTGKPLEGVQFKITYADGRFVDAEGGKLSSNGLYVTDQNGQIILNQITGTIMVTEVQTIPGYSIDENTRTQTVVVNPDDTQTLTFTNTPIGGLIITKSDESSGKRLSGVQFEVRRMNGEIIGTYTTDRNGVIQLPQLDSGWYTVTELKTVSGYQLDTTPQQVEVKDGQTATLALTNRKTSNILLHKVDADTSKGIYGATFLLYDSSHNPIGQYTTDQNGYIYMDEGLADGRYYLREIQAADGYILDTQLKTIYVQYGATSEITWKNTAIRGQIQIIKKSADDNSINGLPAGTLLEGAVFEVYDKAGNKVDTIRTDRNGRAVSKLLPLSRYTIREVSALAYYAVNPTVMTAYLEYEGQIVTFEVLDSSVATGVSITKSGPKEVMPGQPIRYTLKDIANTSTVPLSSFYWRDTLPGQMTLSQIVTGTYNQQLSYKVVYKTNLSGSSYRTLADNLSTSKNYVLDARPAILKLASNERITEVMFVFGQVKAGFAQVETPSISGSVAKGLSNGSNLVNVADVGGLYNGQWIQAVSRTLTGVYAKTTVTLPKTGY